MDAVTISFSIGLLIFLLGMVGFVVYMLFCLWKNHREIVRKKSWPRRRSLAERGWLKRKWIAEKGGPRSLCKNLVLPSHLDLSCKKPMTSFRRGTSG